MKLGVFAAVFGDKTFVEALDTAKKLGFSAVELGAGNFAGTKDCDPYVLLKDDDALKRFLNEVEKRGLFISALNASGNPLHPDKEYSRKNKHDLEKAVELAGRIGVKVVNTFAGCPGADESSKTPNWITCPWPPYYADAIKWQWESKIVPFWLKMAEKAKKHNVKFGFEMHPGDSVYNPETLLLLREKVGMDEISCNLDPSHLFWQGIDPIIAVRRLGDMIVHVHAKDCRVDNSVVEFRGCLDWKHYSDILNRAWTFRTVGYGHSLDFWNDFFSILRSVKYDGVISIEHEDPLMSPAEGLNKAINFLKGTVLFESAGDIWWA
jgi:sugar phosphate isomerase/epimerase